jgi:glycosyltransferase involved in cell wall biosynthesis
MLSVIICTFNEEFYLPKLLDSILAQNYPGLDIIIVDGGSTDGTASVVKDYQKRGLPLRFIELNGTRGIALQRNTGAEAAKHNQLLFLDADVVLPPNFFAEAEEELGKRNLSVSGTKIYAAENSRFVRFLYWAYSNTYLPVIRLTKPVIHGCSIFSTKELHRQIGGFKEDILFEDYRYGVDAKKFCKPALLKNAYVRTSARRFYSGSFRGVMELLIAGVFSFFQTGIKSKSLMKEYHSLTGKHSKPRY